jgi:hypothetical protein
LVAGIAAAVDASEDLDDKLVGDLVYFSVSQSRPEQRKVVLPPHIDHSKTKIEVVVYDVCSRDGIHGCTLKPRSVATAMDLLPLAMPARLASIAAWCSVSRSMSTCLADQAVQAMRDTDIVGVGPALEVVPIQDDLMGVVDDVQVMQFFDGVSADTVLHCNNIVAQLSHGGSLCDEGGRMSVFDAMACVQGLRNTDIDLLVEVGVLTTSQDEFGESLVSLVRSDLIDFQWLSKATTQDA